MSNKTLNLNPPLYHYLLTHSLRESKILTDLREETSHLTGAVMQISPEQGQFMALLMRLMGAKKTLDIGTFTGYSALVVAMALPSAGKVISCDISDENTKVAEKYWELAGVREKIELRVAPALQTLEGLLERGEAGTFDFVFIDADKNNYVNYYEKSLQLLKPGGLMMVDNVLWSGKVADPTNQEETTVSIRRLNEIIVKDSRVDVSMLPVGDGVSLVLKN